MKLTKDVRKNKWLFLLLVIFSMNTSPGRAQSSAPVGGKSSQSPVMAVDETEALKPYSSAEGRFTVLFPSSPVETTSHVETPSGKLDVHSYDAGSGAAYHVSYVDFPESESIRDVKAFFAGVRESGVKRVNGTLLAERAVYIPEGPGFDYKARFGNKYVTWVRSFLIRRRFYQLSITFQEQEASDDVVRSHEETAAKFIKSFRPIPVSGQPGGTGDPLRSPGLPRQGDIERDPKLPPGRTRQGNE